MSARGHLFTKPIAGHWNSDGGTGMANRYAGMKREYLAYGQRSDLELANDIFLADRGSFELIALQTAAKERIRWLSVQLAIASSEVAA